MDAGQNYTSSLFVDGTMIRYLLLDICAILGKDADKLQCCIYSNMQDLAFHLASSSFLTQIQRLNLHTTLQLLNTVATSRSNITP